MAVRWGSVQACTALCGSARCVTRVHKHPLACAVSPAFCHPVVLLFGAGLQVQYKNVIFTVWDVGGQEKLRPLW